jgi:hypothetical protein
MSSGRILQMRFLHRLRLRNVAVLIDKTGKHPFSAGRYRPKISELDAVSFIVTKYSDLRIVLHFGSYYHLVGMPHYHWRLSARDHVTVNVKGSSRQVTVKY